MNLKSTLESQKKYFQTQATRDIGTLKKLLSVFRTEILNREEDIYQALHKDFKKSKFESYLGEIGIVISEIDTTIKHINTWSKPKKVKASLVDTS